MFNENRFTGFILFSYLTLFSFSMVTKSSKELFGYVFDNLSKDHLIKSELLDVFTAKDDSGEIREPCVAGIDEAGRGPVLGPMVYAIAVCPLSRYEELKAMEVKDSKTLSEEEREHLFRTINKNPQIIHWQVHVLHPAYISRNMLSLFPTNLNALSHNSALGLVRSLVNSGINVKELYVDTVGPPLPYQEKFEKNFPSTSTTVTPKADDLFPIVSAASICAKVCRDWICKNWIFEIPQADDVEYGCGYPSDPKTSTWLESESNRDALFGFPNFVRFSWSTAQKVLEKNCVEIEWADEEEPEKPSRKRPANNTAIDSFFCAKSETNQEPKRMRQYFANTHLSNVTHLAI